MIIVKRHHDISCGHRVVGHEGKCRHLHGHNYRVHFHCAVRGFDDELDAVGRVIDFDVIKSRLCQWLEDHWDHRMLIHDADPLARALMCLDAAIVLVPFNPTAENMAKHLVCVVGPEMLADTDVVLFTCTIDETRKCSATYALG